MLVVGRMSLTLWLIVLLPGLKCLMYTGPVGLLLLGELEGLFKSGIHPLYSLLQLAGVLSLTGWLIWLLLQDKLGGLFLVDIHPPTVGELYIFGGWWGKSLTFLLTFWIFLPIEVFAADKLAIWGSWGLEVHVASSWPSQEHCGAAQEGEKSRNSLGRGNIVLWPIKVFRN